MMNETKFFFDLDGTVFDLYNKTDWLKSIETERSGLFKEWGSNHGFLPNINRTELIRVADSLINKGATFAVISWLPAGCSPEYAEVCRQEKIEWVRKYLPFVDEISILPYGTPKQYGIQTKAKRMILLDDNSEIIQMWSNKYGRIGETVDNSELQASAVDILHRYDNSNF